MTQRPIFDYDYCSEECPYFLDTGVRRAEPYCSKYGLFFVDPYNDENIELLRWDDCLTEFGYGGGE